MTRKLISLASLSLLFGCPSDDPSQGNDESSTGSADTSGSPTSSPTTTPTTTTLETTDPDTSVGTDPDTGSTTSNADTAAMRVVHAAPGAPNVDVYVEGSDTPVITDLPYAQASEYLEVPAGSYNFQVRAAGAPAGDPPAYETGALELPADAVITAVAAGVLGSDDEADAFRVLPLAEGFADPGAGNAAVRLVHAGADAPSVDVNVGNDGGAPELPGVARFADSGPEGVALPSGTALQVGIESGGEVVTAFTTPELPEGAQLFVVATGLLAALPRESTGFGLLAVGPDGVIGLIQQNPIVYALHASPDAGEVDICVADTPLVVGAEYFDLARVQVPPGSYDLEFHAAPSDCTGEPVSTQPSGELAAGQQYLAIATGEVSPEAGDDNQAFQLAAYVEQFDLDAAPEATFRIIHSAVAPTVDVGTLDGNGQLTDDTLLVTDLSWPDESDAITVPAGDYEVGVIGANAMLPDPPLAAYLAPLGEGTRAWAIAVGDLQSNGGEPGFSVWALLTDTQPWTLVELPEA
ncbi:MAG TPA: DUF4397 domain-containing protein [Nannocystaceae bacterium]|nr:DUF4397 domain-containing protein [Nannocystaceae bacterium]